MIRKDYQLLTPLYPIDNNYHELVAMHGLDLSRFKNYPVFLTIDGVVIILNRYDLNFRPIVYSDNLQYLVVQINENNVISTQYSKKHPQQYVKEFHLDLSVLDNSKILEGKEIKIVKELLTLMGYDKLPVENTDTVVS